jgi:hypothetical protein
VRRILGTLVVLVVLLGGGWALASWREAEARRAYARERAVAAPVTVDTVAVLDPVLYESSGLAVSRAHAGVVWTHNDSGDRPRVYALGPDGRLAAIFDVAGAEAIDWEDADLGRCPDDGARWCLFLADTGDNARRREVLTVYVVPEPDPADSTGRTEPARALRYTYGDAFHDCEALAVGPDGDLVVVSKGRGPDIRLFHLGPEAVRAGLASGEVVRLTAPRVLPIVPDWSLDRVVTGAAFAPDGSTLAVRTYSEVFFFAWPLGEAGVEVASFCYLGDLDEIGEAVALEVGGSILLTSESTSGRPGVLTRIRCAGTAGRARRAPSRRAGAGRRRTRPSGLTGSA